MRIRKTLNDYVSQIPYVGKVLTTEIPVKRAALTLSALLALLLPSCGKKQEDPLIILGGGRIGHWRTYKIIEDRLIQTSEDQDKTAKLGVIADPHGFYQNVEAFCLEFKKQGADGIIMLGDYAQHFRQKRDPKLSDLDEIVLCLAAAANTGLPVFVVPGNHDMRKTYARAIKKLSEEYEYQNIFDMSKIRVVDGDDFDLISAPCGTDFTYHKGSFKSTQEKIRGRLNRLMPNIPQDDDPEILVSHQPPRCQGEDGIDVVSNGRNVGSDALDQVMRENGTKFSTSGHIHEAGARGCTSTGSPIKPGVFSDDLRFNPGSASPWTYLNGKTYSGCAGILTIKGNKAKYEIIAED